MNVFEKTTCKVHYIGTNSAKLAIVDGLVGMYIKTRHSSRICPFQCIITYAYIYIYEVTCT